MRRLGGRCHHRRRATASPSSHHACPAGHRQPCPAGHLRERCCPARQQARRSAVQPDVWPPVNVSTSKCFAPLGLTLATTAAAQGFRRDSGHGGSCRSAPRGDRLIRGHCRASSILRGRAPPAIGRFLPCGFARRTCAPFAATMVRHSGAGGRPSFSVLALPL